jgi:hypothetical protein
VKKLLASMYIVIFIYGCTAATPTPTATSITKSTASQVSPQVSQGINSNYLIGWWTEIVDTSKLEEYARDGNTLVLAHGGGYFASPSERLKIGAFLDEAHKQGIKVIVSMTKHRHTPYDVPVDEFVDTIAAYKEHPALYGWYIADEPENFDDEMGGIQVVHGYLDIDPGYYHLVKQTDPSHPTYITHNQELSTTAFFDVCEITGIHQYPFWSLHPGEFSHYRQREIYSRYKYAFEKATVEGKDFIAVAQGFGDNFHFPYRNPRYSELRYQVFSAVVLGVDKVLFWYDGAAAPTMIERVKTIIGEVRSIGIEMNNGVSNDPQISISVSPKDLPYRYGMNGNRHILLALNVYGWEEDTGRSLDNVRFELPSRVNPTHVEVLYENRALPVNNGVFYDDFSQYEVHIYAWEE